MKKKSTSLILVCTLSVLGLTYFSFKSWEKIKIEQQHLIEATSQYNQVSEELKKVNSDILIEENGDPPENGEKYYKGCVRAATERFYGSYNSYEAVVKQYESQFNKTPWQLKQMEGINGPRALLQTPQFDVTIEQTDESVSGNHKVKTTREFPLIYRIYVVFADPAIAKCYG